jgi:hypothetical protein
MHAWVVNHLFREYVYRQTRRLALRNDLTPGQPRRIVDESEYFNLPLKERPSKKYAVQGCGQIAPGKAKTMWNVRTSSHPQRVTVYKDTSADSPYTYAD